MDKSYGCSGNAEVVGKGPQSVQGSSETTLAFTCISTFKAALRSQRAWISPDW